MVAVVQASPGAEAAAPAEGLPPGVSVTVSVTPADSSAAAAPLVATTSPSPSGRHLLADAVSQSGTGVNVNITITAPASDMNNITSLVNQAVQSQTVQRQLQEAGELMNGFCCLVAACTNHLQQCGASTLHASSDCSSTSKLCCSIRACRRNWTSIL